MEKLVSGVKDNSKDFSRISESTDSDNESLTIALECESTPKKKSKLKKKPERPQFDGRTLDRTIEETIEKCENITPEAAKKMLLKLIKNEHILALSLLKAEEQEDQDRSKKSSDSDDDDKKSETEAPSTPKLTRLKAKQLNKTLPTPGSLTAPEPCQDVVALVQDELVGSDDEDNEYQPCQSDEDVTNTTFSDIESQPSTPGSALLYSEQDFDSPVKDGDFKMPKLQSLSAAEQENISRRTRSKLCLTTTTIETIESTFIPPDITTDMYDFDQDHEIDNEWKEFLNEFMMPLTNVEEDDEKSDPEYVAAESVPVDREELRPVRVSKKELNQLISELLEDSCLNFDSEPSTSSKRSSSDGLLNSKSKRQRMSSQSPKISSRMYTAQELLLSTPPSSRYDSSVSGPSTSNDKRKDKKSAPAEQSEQISVNPFYQQHQLTPQRMGFTTPTLMESPTVFPSPPTTQLILQTPPAPEMSKFPQITGVYGSVPSTPNQQAQTPSILVMNSQNQLELTSPLNLINQAFCSNGIVQLPQFQSVVVQVPTIDLLQNRVNFSSLVAQNTEPSTSEDAPSSDVEDSQNSLNEKKKPITNRKVKLEEFDYLETMEPPEEKVFSDDCRGFTAEQKEIFEQQMRMHAQLLAQHHLQTYANPKWWEKSEPMKKNLIELKEIVNPKVSPLTSVHINNCLTMCNSWERELEENSERNKKYAEFLYEEFDYDVKAFDDHHPFRGRFHNRLMEHILSSKAILYPMLLPKIPFRAVTFNQIAPTNSELCLMAFGLQRFYQELYDKLNSKNPFKIRDPKIGSITRHIIREFKSFRLEKNLIKIFETYKGHPKMNPIKYFFAHKKAPPFEHELEVIKKIVAPKNLRRGLLPKIWDTYMFSYNRLQQYPYTPDEEDVEIVEDLTSETEIQEIEGDSPSEVVEVYQPPSSTVSTDNRFRIEITCDVIPRINICLVNKTPEKSPELKVSCINLCTPPKLREKSNTEKQNNLISILKKVSDKNLEKVPTKKKTVNFLLPTPPRNRSSPRFTEKLKNTQEIANTFVLTQKFFIVIESFFTNYIKSLKFRNGAHQLLIRVFHWTKSIDIYLKLLYQSTMISKKRQNDSSAASGSTETGAKPKKHVSSIEEYSKRLHRKLSENQTLIMQGDRNKGTIEKDCSYAYNYIDRVKKTLTDNGDDELYAEFMSMLTTFDPECESVPELFHKVETLLLPNYSELVDLFLTFLLPEHATQVGKFFEHFVLSNMSNLLQKLNFYFNKQPSHIKKVYTCLNDLSNEQNLTMDRLKAKVLPLLKGNQLLIDWFLELFDKPIESLPGEYESVYIKKSLSDSDNSVDNYEEIHSKDLIECGNIEQLNTCNVRYKNGKLTYHGTLLPAKISFLAHDAPSASTLKIGDTPLCMHQIRNHVKFNDPKKLEEAPIVDESKNPPKKIAKKFKLCDAQTLHAHAVRLNSVHAQNGEKLSDLAHLLTPTSGNKADDDKSPKKQRSGKRSPKKTVNNKSPSSGNSVAISPLTPQSPSKALQTAKKLRSLTDDGAEEQLKKKMKPSDVAEPSLPKVGTLGKSADKKRSLGRSDKASNSPSTSKKSDTEGSSVDDERGAGGWTRDEDQLILEQFQLGYDNKEDLLDVLLLKLTRTRSEISARYEFLLDIVKMHQTKRVKN